MGLKTNYIKLLNLEIIKVFLKAFMISVFKPSLSLFLLKTLLRQKKAARIRDYWQHRKVHVPPVVISSITNHCNLKCKGCYTRVLRSETDSELTIPEWRRIIKEAEKLGVSFMLIAGGEPFMRPDFLKITANSKNIIFPVFTNGLLFNKDIVALLKKQKNVIPIISIEGDNNHTDNRRGQGVHRRILATFRLLKRENIFFGVSLTTTKNNFEYITKKHFITSLSDSGCKLFIFVDYIPVQKNTEKLVLSDSEREIVTKRIKIFNKKDKGIFLLFPGNEERYGGCLSAGRGFIHISANGNLEPCPFAPYSDTNLRNTELKQALQSQFLEKIQKNYYKLNERNGGCALWNNRQWVYSLL